MEKQPRGEGAGRNFWEGGGVVLLKQKTTTIVSCWKIIRVRVIIFSEHVQKRVRVCQWLMNDTLEYSDAALSPRGMHAMYVLM